MFFPQSWDSIKTRVTLSALGAFLLGLGLLAFFTTRILERDISQLIADTQAATVEQMALQLDRELGGRLTALERVAAGIDSDVLAQTDDVQAFLEAQPLLQDLFNVSVLAVDRRGVGIADVPYRPERVGVSFRDRVDAITTALDEGRPSIGRPIVGASTGHPLIPLATPILASDGTVIGALGGAIDLSQPNFFSDLMQASYAKSGVYSIVSKSERRIVTSSNPEFIMRDLPPPGQEPLLDQAISGADGAGRYRTLAGVETFATIRHLQVTDWFVAALIPVDEAFAPITSAQHRMLLLTLLISVLTGVLIWSMLRLQLQPMINTVKVLGTMSGSNPSPLHKLGLTGRTEIDALIIAFNRLLHDVNIHQQENRRFRTIADIAVYGNAISDLDGKLIYINRFFATVHGYERDELIGRNLSIFHASDQLEPVQANLDRLLSDGHFPPQDIWHMHRDGSRFPMLMSGVLLNDSAGQPEYFAISAIDITEQKKFEARIQHLAYFDPLTELPNRRLFHDRLCHALIGARRSGRYGALVFLDIDQFQRLNDTRGHDAGDKLLIETAERTRSSMRESDTVARMGGDEFVVMLEDLSRRAEEAALYTRQVAEKLRLVLAKPYAIDGVQYHCSASIGLVLFNGQDESVDSLLRQADLAMYKAKESGRNTVRFFDPGMQTALDERTTLEYDLRSALARGQLSLHYQAQVDAAGRVVGAEALLRWQHPEHGMVAPDRFIKLAEESGLIVPIGLWVMASACRQIAAWSQHPGMDQLHVAVNVSAREFRSEQFVDQVHQVLTETGADPSRLRIELTESMILDDVDATLEKMQILQAVGIEFALDDFGTGYSSLSYLTRLPLHTLKIDRSFVRNLPMVQSDAIIAQTIINMAKNLEIEVLAEGVENTEQRAFLAAHGCPLYQGYLFCRPLPLADFEHYCATSSNPSASKG